MTITAQTAAAQMSTELKPETLRAFKQYVAKVEAVLDKRDSGDKPFLWLDEHPNQRRGALKGEIVVHQFGDDVIKVKDGLIHHWLGAAFMRGVTGEEAATLLHDSCLRMMTGASKYGGRVTEAKRFVYWRSGLQPSCSPYGSMRPTKILY